MKRTRNLLCVVPPYFTSGAPPLGPAALLAYLRAHGHDDFDFLDLRLWVPNAYAPTYRATGVFGETFVMDVPDLPIVLGLLQNFEKGKAPLPDFDERFVQFCLERAISATLLSEYLLAMNRFLETAFEQLPDLAFVGFSTWSSNFHTTLMAAAHLKRRRNPPLIVLGGPQTTESEASAKLALQSGLADFVARGEGEETLLRLYEAFVDAKGTPTHAIPGTVRYDRRTKSFETAERPLLRMGDLPLPAFDKLPLLAYQRRHTPHRAVTYELSRGCTDKCVFCSEWAFWKNIRVAKTERVIDGIERLQRDFGADVVWFMDSLLNANVSRLRQLAEELLRRDLRVKWGGYLRANVDRETAALLKRAGCEFVFVGVESLSDETLERMRKRRTGADNIQALEALLDGGIDRVVAGFIPGFPGDSRARFTSTALLLGDIHRRYPGRFRVNVEPFTVSPMQPMFRHLSDYGLEAVAWDARYQELAGEYGAITAGVLCSVTGPNQGIDRLGEIRVAQTVTATAPVEADPFMYYEGEQMSVGALRVSELADGWYMGLMKSDGALVYGLILNREERLEYERLERDDMVGYGFGYGRRPHASLFGREPFAGYLRSVAERHLVPPRCDAPALRPGRYSRHRARDCGTVCLSPFAVVRTGRGDAQRAVMVLDLATGKWHHFDAEWEELFRHMAAGPVDLAELPASECSKVEQLVELGLCWAEGDGAVAAEQLAATAEKTAREWA